MYIKINHRAHVVEEYIKNNINMESICISYYAIVKKLLTILHTNQPTIRQKNATILIPTLDEIVRKFN